MKLICTAILFLFVNQLAQCNELLINRHLTSKNCPESIISIGWHNYLPYSFFNPQAKRVSGSDIELITSILDEMDCRYSFVRMTWARTLLELKEGNIDMSMYAYFNNERESLYLFSEPYRSETVRIAILKDNRNRWSIESLDDIVKQDILVAVDTHVWAGNAFKKLIEHRHGHQILHVHDINRRIKMLLEKRVDAIVGDPLTIAIEAKKYNADSEYFLDDYVIFEQPVHFVFNKEKFEPSFIREFNHLLKSRLLRTD